jgi:23S rRNA (guanosine2251-2'-O)-methyltransferase
MKPPHRPGRPGQSSSDPRPHGKGPQRHTDSGQAANKSGGKPGAKASGKPAWRDEGFKKRPSAAAAPRSEGGNRLSLSAPRPNPRQHAGTTDSDSAVPYRPQRPKAPGQPGITPSGALWLYGLHPVAAALKNPHRRLRRLVLTAEGEAALRAAAPLPWPIGAEPIERARLDQMLGPDAVHQGIGLLADPLIPPQLTAMMERPGPILVLDQVTDPRNVGAILRSAAAFAAAGVIVQDRHAPEESAAMAKAASGALEIVPMIRAVNLARTLVALRAAGYWCVGLAADGKRLNGADFRERKVALVLGAEGEGLRRLTRDTCDEIAGLAMPGGMESLNVSAAATVALYEMSRKG